MFPVDRSSKILLGTRVKVGGRFRAGPGAEGEARQRWNTPCMLSRSLVEIGVTRPEPRGVTRPMKTPLTTSIALGFLALPNSGFAHGDRCPPAELRRDLQVILDTAVSDGSPPGASLHVRTEHGAGWADSAGLADVENEVPLSTRHRTRAGSVLKSMVATAVLQLAEEDMLDLDEPLTRYLAPDITDAIPFAAEVSLRMLLGHRSGVAEWVTDDVVKARVLVEPSHVWTTEEILAIVSSQTPVFRPGERYGYSNTNYVLLGHVLEAVEGRPWRAVVRRRVLRRADLAHTRLPAPGTVCPEPCAHGYQEVGGQWLDLTNVDPSMAGASGGHALVTTPTDLTRFHQKLLSGALFRHAATLSTMLDFQPAADDQPYQVAYGLGLARFDIEGHEAIGHVGSTAGYFSYMLYLPATQRFLSGYINLGSNTESAAVVLPLLLRLDTPDSPARPRL